MKWRRQEPEEKGTALEGLAAWVSVDKKVSQRQGCSEDVWSGDVTRRIKTIGHCEKVRRKGSGRECQGLLRRYEVYICRTQCWKLMKRFLEHLMMENERQRTQES